MTERTYQFDFDRQRSAFIRAKTAAAAFDKLREQLKPAHDTLLCEVCGKNPRMLVFGLQVHVEGKGPVCEPCFNKGPLP